MARRLEMTVTFSPGTQVFTIKDRFVEAFGALLEQLNDTDDISATVQIREPLDDERELH